MTKNEQKSGSLAAALLAAQSSIDGVNKDARNKFHNYAYTSAEGMIGACRTALHSAGLSFQRTGWQLAEDGQTVVSTFVLRHSASGESETYTAPWIVVVEKGKPVDKALAGALTTSIGYFLRDLLLLPRDEDGGMDARNDDKSRPQPEVGFRRSEAKPVEQSSHAADLRALNSKIAEPKVVGRTAVVDKIESRMHDGKAFNMLRMRDGTTIIVPDNMIEQAKAFVGREAEIKWRDRGTKSGLLQSIARPESKQNDGGGDEPIPF